MTTLIVIFGLFVIAIGAVFYVRHEDKIIDKFKDTKPIDAKEAHANWRKAKRNLTKAQLQEWTTQFNNLVENGNQDFYDHVRIGKHNINLRNSPSIYSGSYGVLWSGAKVKVLEAVTGTEVAGNDTWYRVEIGGMTTKYVWAGAVSEYLPAKKKLSIESKTNAREKPQQTIQKDH